MNPIEMLESVLCDPQGRVCINATDADRRIVTEALTALRGLAQPAEPVAIEVRLACITESNGRETWVVALKKPEGGVFDFLQVYSDTIKGRAEYEAARYKHFLGQGPEPDILSYDPAAPPQGWVSVKERLPNDGIEVPVYTPGEDSRIDFDMLEEGTWFLHNENYEHYVAVGSMGKGPSLEAPYTHWFDGLYPLPSAPEGERSPPRIESTADELRGDKPCYACPDGNEWNSNGPTGRACRVCKGHAVLMQDGSPITGGGK